MADDYFNIGSMNPAQGRGAWQPDGAPAGLDYYNRTKMFNEFMGLKKLMMQMDEQKQRSTLADFETARPHALAATIATHDADTNTVGMRKEGEAKQAKAKGDYDFATLNSRIDDFLDSNDEKKRERGVKGIAHGLQVLDMVGPAVESGDHELVRALTKSAGVRENHRMVDHILNSANPTAALAQWRNNLEQASVRSEAGKIKLKGDFDIKERIIMADAQEFSAYMQLLAAQFRTGSQKAKEKVENLLAKTTTEWFHEKDPAKKAELLEKVNVLHSMIIGHRAAGSPYNAAELSADVLRGRPPNAPGAPAARQRAFPPIPPLRAGQPPEPTDDTIQQQVEGLGERYEPDLYDYEIQNGRLMKSRKQ